MNRPFPIGNFTVEQEPVVRAADLDGEYDLRISVVSWERRALAATPLLTDQGGDCVLLRFASSNQNINDRKQVVHDQLVASLGGESVVILLSSSKDYGQNFPKLEALFAERFSIKKHPLRVLIDMTCLPKKYLLFVLAMGFRRGYVTSFDFLYGAGAYQTVPGVADPAFSAARGIISIGEWSSVQVPYLESEEFAAGKRDLFISLGAEISAAMPIIQRFEPQRMVLLHINERQRILDGDGLAHEVSALKSLQDQPNCDGCSHELNDIIGLAKTILDEAKIATTCLAIGSKPHALALGLAALSRANIEVVCRLPAEYTATDVEPTGDIFRFKIKDRFDPLSYLSTKQDPPRRS